MWMQGSVTATHEEYNARRILLPSNLFVTVTIVYLKESLVFGNKFAWLLRMKQCILKGSEFTYLF